MKNCSKLTPIPSIVTRNTSQFYTRSLRRHLEPIRRVILLFRKALLREPKDFFKSSISDPTFTTDLSISLTTK